MKCRPNWDRDAQYIEERIGWRIRGLLGKFGFTQSDIKDLEQEFRIDLIVRLKSFNPERAHRRTFISRIISNKAATLIESQKAQKRNFTRSGFSLNEEVPGSDGDVCSRLEQMEAADYKHRVFDRFICQSPRYELLIDLTAALPNLPSELRLICDLLSQGEKIVDVAARLRCSRATIYSRIEDIRQRFIREGLSP